MEYVYKKHFWPNNDSEKWSRKNYFEIPPCGKLLSLTSKKGRILTKIANSVIKMTFAHGGISKNFSMKYYAHKIKL